MREKFPPYATDVYSSGVPPSFEDFSVSIHGISTSHNDV